MFINNTARTTPRPRAKGKVRWDNTPPTSPPEVFLVPQPASNRLSPRPRPTAVRVAIDWESKRPAGFTGSVWEPNQQGGFLANRLAGHAAEAAALDDYTGGESLYMNAAERPGSKLHALMGPSGLRRTKTANGHLSDLVAAAPPTDRDQLVFRGADHGPPGRVWRKPDFTSTSFRWETALHFNTERGVLKPFCLMVIRIPGGARVLEVGEGGAFLDTEGEVLINRNSLFIVDAVAEIGRYTIFYMTLQ